MPPHLNAFEHGTTTWQRLSETHSPGATNGYKPLGPRVRGAQP